MTELNLITSFQVLWYIINNFNNDSIYENNLLTLRFHLQDFNQVFPLTVKLRMVQLAKQLQLKYKDLIAKFPLRLSRMEQRMIQRRPLNYNTTDSSIPVPRALTHVGYISLA